MKTLIGLILRIQEKRCAKCPAAWSSCDYWGEWDEGCELHNDYFGFCKNAFLPHWIIRLKIKLWQRKEDRRFDAYSRGADHEEITRDKLRDAINEEFEQRGYKLADCTGYIFSLDDTLSLEYDIASRFIEKLAK